MNDFKMPEFKDMEFTCIDCGETFTWNAGEQDYFYCKGLAKPRRCPKCRAYRKATIRKDGGWTGEVRNE